MRSKRVLVAMSGGVDSSVTAYLLKEKGYEVIGVTLQLLPKKELYNLEEFGGCCGLNLTIHAKKVASSLGIRHYVLSIRELFREKVIDNFCKEYRQGRTPNPCIKCNQFIKFGYLLRKAKELDIEFVATGHYARIEYDESHKKYLLKKGVDSKKDQSYVLYMITQNQLDKILLPLGNHTKEEVREKAKEVGLPTAKTESQEICFIPGNNYRRFLKDLIPEVSNPGLILNNKGKVLGRHPGIAFYTIGQRKGLGISNKEALYVTAINSKTNSIFVDTEKNLYSDKLIAKGVNYIHMGKTPKDFVVKAKIRYLHKEAEAKLEPIDKKTVRVNFKRPQRAITPGQAVVFYKGDVVIGGGIIDRC